MSDTHSRKLQIDVPAGNHLKAFKSSAHTYSESYENLEVLSSLQVIWETCNAYTSRYVSYKIVS